MSNIPTSLSSLLIIIFVLPITSQAYEYLTNCTGSPNYTQNSPYQKNLNTLLTSLPSQASITGFYNSSLGQNPNQVYALFLCRGDTDAQSCSDCVYQAQINILLQCPSQIWALIWYDECMLRFSNESLYDKMEVEPTIATWNPVNITSNETTLFAKVLNNTVNQLVPEVANSVVKYGTKEANVTSSEPLYTLGQCTPELSANDCQKCLEIAIPKLPFMLGARVLQPSCNLRFEVSSFYNNSVNSSFLLAAMTSNLTGTPPSGKHRKSHKSILIAIILPIVLAVFLLSLLSGACFCIRSRKGFEALPELDEIRSAESLQFDFRTIRAATDNFSIENKLGEGGFGGVYKGRLQNGQEIAVKRLSTNSGQGDKEFKTEVLLVAKLQHKNLVRLLGFCLAGKEKLLVYELLPNSSLDKVLLDRNRSTTLDWETRYKIIAGIARGLLYLHEDSRLKIIHRDLKSSNILLDESMNPKISDFGLAKLVGADQIQADTNRIVGTYGYMAPEYAMTGRFSIKSDVYSFGVIVLEIITGHKCSSTAFPFHEESLNQRAWRLWNQNEALELVDSRLGSDFSHEEVEKCIQISLLCIQEDAGKRPTMAPIVSALNGHPVVLAVPTPPQLLKNSVGGSSQSSSTFSGSKDTTEIYPR